VSHSLTRFLSSLDIPLVTTLRDTQNYLRSAEAGIGIHDMPRWQVQQDLDHWQHLTDWLSAKRRGQQLRPELRGVAISEAS
jgi:chromosome partitioning protein